MTLRYALLALVLAAAPASAQTYGFLAETDLTLGTSLATVEPDCVLASTDDETGLEIVIFFDDASDQIIGHIVGAGSVVVSDAAALTVATGATIDRCRDATQFGNEFGIFVLADSDNVNYVVRFEEELMLLNDPGSTTDASEGIVGVALSNEGDTLYLTRSAFNGAPEDGVYTLDAAMPGQTPVALEVNPDYDLNGIAVDADGDLYVVSSEFGSGDFVNVVLKIGLPVDADPEVFATPCADGPFTGCGTTNDGGGSDGGGLEDLLVVTNPDDETQQRLFVTNNAFESAEGVQVASYDLDGSDASVVFTSTAFIAATSAEGYTTAGTMGYLGFLDDTLFLGGRDAFGGTPGIATVTVPFPTDAEGTPGSAFALELAPNPAAGTARVAVTAETAGALTVDVLDLLGRRVATLFEGSAAAGQTVTTTAAGLAPGVYLVRVQSAAGVATQRLTVVR